MLTGDEQREVTTAIDMLSKYVERATGKPLLFHVWPDNVAIGVGNFHITLPLISSQEAVGVLDAQGASSCPTASMRLHEPLASH
jgi:hypothetical protein